MQYTVRGFRHLPRAALLRPRGDQPQNFGSIGWTTAPLHGLRVALAGSQCAGTLRAQCILRAFSDDRIDELVGEADRTIDGDDADVSIAFAAGRRQWGVGSVLKPG